MNKQKITVMGESQEDSLGDLEGPFHILGFTLNPQEMALILSGRKNTFENCALQLFQPNTQYK